MVAVAGTIILVFMVFGFIIGRRYGTKEHAEPGHTLEGYVIVVYTVTVHPVAGEGRAATCVIAVYTKQCRIYGILKPSAILLQ